MTDRTAAQRQEALRARRLMLGLTEVRGIYAAPDDHAAIKKYAAKLQKARLSGNHKPLAILPESV